jgi:hypothetical protein
MRGAPGNLQEKDCDGWKVLKIVDWFLPPTALFTYTKLLASRGTMLNVEGKIIVPSSYGVLGVSWEILNKT